MSITMQPSAVINFCHVPFESDGKHNIYFKPTSTETSAQLRDNYFTNLTGKLEVYDYTYIRKDSSIKVNMNYELMQRFNYCYYINYTNSDHSAATITDNGYTATIRKVFCFITGLEYINENCTKVTIQTDVWNTFLEEIKLDTTSQSYIERMHVSDDSIGSNIIPESLEHGEYIVNSQLAEASLNANTVWCRYNDGTSEEATINESLDCKGLIVIGVTKSIEGSSHTIPSIASYYSITSGIYTGLKYLIFTDTTQANYFLRWADYSGFGDAIYTMFMIPVIQSGTQSSPALYGTRIENFDIGTASTVTFKYLTIQGLTGVSTLANVSFNPFASGSSVLNFKYSSKTGSYTPKNKKLYNDPYSYIQLIDGSGKATTYNYEYYTTKTSIAFTVYGSISQGMSISAIPLNYKNLAENNNETFAMTKFPTCCWTTDSYTNWLTQTAVTRETNLQYINDKYSVQKIASVGTGVSSIANGVTTGASVGGVIGSVIPGVGTVVGAAVGATVGLLSAANKADSNIYDYQKKIDDINNEVYEHSYVSPRMNQGGQTVELNFARGLFNFKWQAMQITGEYAEKIDEYFTRYGYKVLRSSNIVSALATRNYWNYIKCVECNIHNDSIPDEYMQEIKSLFTNGITLWHNATMIYKYNYNNDIV